MPQTKYLKQNGEVIYPITLAENIVNARSGGINIIAGGGGVYGKVTLKN